MPPCFVDFPDTRIVVGCTEIFSQQASSTQARKQMFSSYKPRQLQTQASKSPFLPTTATPIWPPIFFSSYTVNFFASFHDDSRVTSGDVSRWAWWDWPAADGICSSLLAIRAPAGTIQDVQARLRQATSRSRRRLRQQRPPHQHRSSFNSQTVEGEQIRL